MISHIIYDLMRIRIIRRMIVNFDQEKGNYLKINKKTGQSSISHRDGSPPKEFKPAYTGSNYL